MATPKVGGTEESDDDRVTEESLGTSGSMEEIDAKEATIDEDETSIEMISPTESDDSPFESPSRSILVKGEAMDFKLSGWLMKLSGLGFRKAVKNVWFVYGEDTGKLYYYRQPQDLLPLGEIDVCNSSFTYNVSNRDKPGLFEIRSDDKVHILEAEDRIHMLYWLEALQRKRREFNHKRSAITSDIQQIITGRKRQIAGGLLAGESSENGAASSSESPDLRQESEEQVPARPNSEAAKPWSLLSLRDEIRKSMSLLRRPDSLGVGKGLRYHQGKSEEWTMVDEPPSPPDFPYTIPSGNSQWHVPSDFTTQPTPTSQTDPAPTPTTPQPVSSSSTDAQNFSTTNTQTSSSHTKSSDSPQLPKLSVQSKHTESSQSQPKSKQQILNQNQKQQPTSPPPPNASFSSVVSPTTPQPNGKTRFMSALGSKFKLMKDNVRDKGNIRSPPGPTKSHSFSEVPGGDGNVDPAALTCSRCHAMGEDILSLKEDLRAAEDELAANREIVRLLQKEVDYMRQQILTRKECEGMEEESLMLHLKQKDKHVVELEHSMAAILEEKNTLQQNLRVESNALRELKEQISMFQQTLAVKDEIIVSLTNQNQELKNNNQHPANIGGGTTAAFLSDPVSLVAERKEMERLQDTCQAFEAQMSFLTREIVELNDLRQEDDRRERTLNMQIAKLEAENCRTMSKYLFLLKEKQTPVRGGGDTKSQEVVTQLLEEALSSESIMLDPALDTNGNSNVNKGQSILSSQGKEYDEFGFLTCGNDDDDVILSRANMLQRHSVEMENMIRDKDEETSKHIKWENFMVGQTTAKHLTRSNDLKALIRLGVPHEFREKIWKGCINFNVNSVKDKLGARYYHDLEQRAKVNKSNPANKQIELDLLRTLPENRHFDKMDSPGIQKLRRVLQCYSVHNPVIGYCQGLNRIAAIALLFLCEEDAFWCMVTIIEHLMPHDYYTTTLAAAQADQRVLKDLVQDKCPRLHSHLELHEVDLSLFTFNWFLTVFVDGVKPELFLRIWDCFLYEGSKVLFRFALAFLKYSEDEILKQDNNLAINRYMRTLGDTIVDVKKIIQMAFHGLNPFPMRGIHSRRQNHLQLVRVELEELEAIRKDFKSAHEEEGRREASRKHSQDYMSDDDLDDV